MRVSLGTTVSFDKLWLKNLFVGLNVILKWSCICSFKYYKWVANEVGYNWYEVETDHFLSRRHQDRVIGLKKKLFFKVQNVVSDKDV